MTMAEEAELFEKAISAIWQHVGLVKQTYAMDLHDVDYANLS